jgi:predicted amidohydrolase YtcJ
MRILLNAHIYTLDARQPQASALAMDQGRILQVGQDADIQNGYAQRGVIVEDMGGAVILPGLVDSHLHLEQYALSLQKVDCETETRAECLQRVAEKVRQAQPGAWILGHGWNQNRWQEGFGDPRDLDAIAPHHPVYLTAKSLHAGWANALALQQAGISAGSPDPPGGRFGRDASQRPNGLLFEAAMNQMNQVIPAPTEEELLAAVRTAQGKLWRLGLTGVHDFDRRACFIALQKLRQAGELRLRVVKSIPIDDLPYAVALGLRTGFGDEFLRIGHVKAFSDGALGPRTAAMLQPYDGEPDNRGMLLLDAEEIFEKGRLAAENGLAMAVHAIGDRANHEVLNAFAQLRSLPGSDQARLRHRIEHVQLLHPDDAGRLAQLGVIASMQPIHATSDMLMADRFWGKRANLSYAWRTQLQNGAVLVFGSDAPVESPNPFWGIHAAVTRQRADGFPASQGWYPEQRLAVSEALQAYTVGPAYAAGREHEQGRLASGFLADLVVLDADPLNCPPENLRNIQAQATMVGGDWVWRA